MSEIAQKSENKWQIIKEARRDDLFDEMAFSLNKDLSDSKKKWKAKEKNTEDLFCKSLVEENASLWKAKCKK